MTQPKNWPARLALWLALTVALLLLLLGPGYRLQWLDLRLIFFKLFPVVVYAGGAAVALGLVGLVMAWRRRGGAVAAALAVVIAVGAVAVPLGMRIKGSQVPAIHDISTDLVNPPPFVAIVPLRAGASNPVAYAGTEVAIKQREAYPDVQTIRLRNTPQDVFAAAQQSVLDLGWELHAADPQTGRIEATDTTLWFGFKDDVVIRIEAAPEVTNVDIRSKSRVGRSDMGVNAARIREFRNELVARLL